jgi:uncharacterized protein YbaR (Trm112 family)
MPIPKEILAILVCDSGYKCEACKRFYPVRDGIPVMLPEEATIAPE